MQFLHKCNKYYLDGTGRNRSPGSISDALSTGRFFDGRQIDTKLAIADSDDIAGEQRLLFVRHHRALIHKRAAAHLRQVFQPHLQIAFSSQPFYILR